MRGAKGGLMSGDGRQTREAQGRAVLVLEPDNHVRAHTHTHTLLVLESDVAVKLLEPLLVDLHPPKHTGERST